MAQRGWGRNDTGCNFQLFINRNHVDLYRLPNKGNHYINRNMDELTIHHKPLKESRHASEAALTWAVKSCQHTCSSQDQSEWEANRAAHNLNFTRLQAIFQKPYFYLTYINWWCTNALTACPFIRNVSIVSLSVRLLARLRKVVWLKCGAQPQRLQWSAKGPPILLLTAKRCFLARSLKHWPVWPMYNIPQLRGILHTTLLTHSVYRVACFLQHAAAAYLPSRGKSWPDCMEQKTQCAHCIWLQSLYCTRTSERKVLRAI